MRFELRITNNQKTIEVVPDNDQEGVLLASLSGGPLQIAMAPAPHDAKVEFLMSPDKPPYRKLTMLRVVL